MSAHQNRPTGETDPPDTNRSDTDQPDSDRSETEPDADTAGTNPLPAGEFEQQTDEQP